MLRVLPMRPSKFALIPLLFWSFLLAAQVLSPMEMTDPAMRRLQQTHLNELKSFANELNQYKFPYAFYFSRKLDIEEQLQKQADQRSIRFERYNNQTTLEITGNYFASYSAERVDADHRLRQTFVEVILPILQSAVRRFGSEKEVESFGIEVSHHVRKTVMGGIKGEFPENVVVVVPRELAVRVAGSSDLATQQNLMLDAEAYISGQPTLLWLAGDKPIIADDHPRPPSQEKREATIVPVESGSAVPSLPGAKLPTLVPKGVPPELKDEPLHGATPQGLRTLQEQHRDAIDRMTREQNGSAHFVQYAPPAFIQFKNGTYLQLSMTSNLEEPSSGSQYNRAALAFDHHISHLVRPVLAYFKDTSGFDGIDFSTTIKASKDKEGANAESVEFVLPMAALRSYAQYDCTGQQLLNAGIVLINGERVGLDLQVAEAR
jgi:hypothetical protein